MQDLKFTKTHEWVKQTQNEILIGITDHAQQLLGDLVFIELPAIGKNITAGDELGVLESVKAAADFYAPVSGTVIAINHEASTNPALINQDPYGNGWLIKLQISDPRELNNLLTHEHYMQQISEDHE